MGITIIHDSSEINKDELNKLYGNIRDYYHAFEKSHLAVFGFEEKKLIGAARIISEGVETALLVDLQVAEGYGLSVKKELVDTLESKLADRRVMVYSKKDDLNFWEEIGYGRCKNAWTYYKDSLSESEFLPSGYKYENEFVSNSVPTLKNPQKTEIVYKAGYENATFEDINELLTKAFWGHQHDIHKTTAAFVNSQYAVSAFDGNKLVGIARAVSDLEHYATILNVAVDPEYQGLSIGKKVVLKLSELIDAEVVVLNTHPGAIGFYNGLKEYRRNKYVFEKHISGGIGTEMPLEKRNAMFTPKGYKFPDEY